MPSCQPSFSFRKMRTTLLKNHSRFVKMKGNVLECTLLVCFKPSCHQQMRQRIASFIRITSIVSIVISNWTVATSSGVIYVWCSFARTQSTFLLSVDWKWNNNQSYTWKNNCQPTTQSNFQLPHERAFDFVSTFAKTNSCIILTSDTSGGETTWTIVERLGWMRKLLRHFWGNNKSVRSYSVFRV